MGVIQDRNLRLLLQAVLWCCCLVTVWGMHSGNTSLYVSCFPAVFLTKLMMTMAITLWSQILESVSSCRENGERRQQISFL